MGNPSAAASDDLHLNLPVFQVRPPVIAMPADRTPVGGTSYREAGVTAELRPVLSLREKQVLQHLADGATTGAAAAALFLAPTTVRSYAEAAMRKLESRTRTHAVAAALREGLIR